MQIILLRGFSNSGKDFIGSVLCEKYGFVRYAFADSLKKIVSLQWDCPLEKFHSQAGKLEICETDCQKRTYRQLLIDEALRLRKTDDAIFAAYTCNNILKNKDFKVVITDWRFKIEIDFISRCFPGAKIVPVHIKRKGLGKSVVDDKSEYELMNRRGDYEILNDMTDSIYVEIERFIAANKIL